MMCDFLYQVDLNCDASLSSPVWISSTIPADWICQFPSEFEASSHQDVCCVKRQSVFELEGDASIDGLFDFAVILHILFCVLSSQLNVRIFPHLGFADILNQQFKNYSSLSQTHSEVKMVQSLVPIWEVCLSRIHLLFFIHLLTFYIVWSFIW